MQVFAQYGLQLKDYFIMPVQRVPRYSMLVRDLIKATNPDHVDFKDLTRASSEFDKLATAINEYVRKTEASAAFVKILERGGGFEQLTKVIRVILAGLIVLSFRSQAEIELGSRIAR